MVLSLGFPKPGNLRDVYKRAQRHPRCVELLALMQRANLIPEERVPSREEVNFKALFNAMLRLNVGPTDYTREWLLHYQSLQQLPWRNRIVERHWMTHEETAWAIQVLVSAGWRQRSKKVGRTARGWYHIHSNWAPPDGWIPRDPAGVLAELEATREA